MEKQQISLEGLSKASDLAHVLIRSRKFFFLSAIYIYVFLSGV